MNNNNYFDDYIKAMYVLNKLVCQFYSYDINQEEAKNLEINYTDDDIFNSLNNVSCVFHRYNPEGMYIWNKLAIDKPIVLTSEMWSYCKNYINIKNQKDDYYKDFLQLKLIIIGLCKRYYSCSISKEDADKNGIIYDEDIDEYNGNIECCYHYFESAGENAWSLLGFDDHMVAISRFDSIENDLIDKLLENELKIQHKIMVKK